MLLRFVEKHETSVLLPNQILPKSKQSTLWWHRLPRNPALLVMESLYSLVLIDRRCGSTDSGAGILAFQVDPNLLRRIEGQLGRSLLNEVESSREQPRPQPVSRLDRARERALERQRTLFGTRPSKRPTRPSRVPSRDSRNQLYGGGECQALKTENRLLKQKLIQQSQETEKPTTAIDVLKQLQDAGHFEEPQGFDGSAPLEQLLAESSVQRERGARLQVGDQREVRSILITPTPTISTIVNTISFMTTITKNITNELILNFNGRKVPTHIVEQSEVVKTSSSLVSTTIEITPTPTWQTIIVTPTTTPPPPPPQIDFQAILQQKEQERLALIAKIKNLQSGSARPPAAFGGIQAEVVEIPEKLESFTSLQQYLEQVIKITLFWAIFELLLHNEFQQPSAETPRVHFVQTRFCSEWLSCVMDKG